MATVCEEVPGKHKFLGPSGVRRTKVIFSYKGRKTEKFAAKVCCAPTLSSVCTELPYRIGTRDFIVHSFEECDPNPEFPGVIHTIEELTRIAQAQYADKLGSRKATPTAEAWLEEKSKEVLHGDSLATGVSSRRRR